MFLEVWVNLIYQVLMLPVQKPRRHKVLIVDDDPGFRKSIRLSLEQNYDVTEAESVAQSIAAFDRQEPDLITLDVNMPEVDGMEGLDIFRRRSSSIPIILISGYHTFELARQALRLGANDYLTKPFTLEELRQTIQTALAKVPHDENSDLKSIDSDADLMLRLPLQNLKEDKFFSVQHRNHFLAFAQNVLSKKKPAFEKIAVHELVKTIDLQFRALRFKEDVVCVTSHFDQKVRIECDMYLLGGVLANLALTCIMETRSDNSPVKLVFDSSEKGLRVLYKKSGLELPKDLKTRFEHWHQNRNTSLDADTAMLALAEKVVHQHKGQFILDVPSGSLLEISLPLS